MIILKSGRKREKKSMKDRARSPVPPTRLVYWMWNADEDRRGPDHDIPHDCYI
jgi:hypothetical protein